MSERKIPFGKYVGRTLSECPIGYLDWLIGEEFLSLRDVGQEDNLKEEIENYLQNCPEWQRM